MKRLTTQQFIEKAKQIHGDIYNYDNVEYINNRTKVKIICSIHGEFEQIPNSHLLKIGCPSCGGTKKLTWSTFLSKANYKHNNKFTYEPLQSFNNKTKVTITCKEHGKFKQQIGNHLNGSDCPKCAGKSVYTKDYFIQKANKIHNNKYDYTNSTITNTHSYINIECPIHGNFKQKMYIHLAGSGCKQCALLNIGWRRSIYKDKPTVLYIIKIGSEYKVGITKNSVKFRYRRELVDYTIEFQATFLDGADAYNLEKIILKQFANHKSANKPLIYSGNSELLTISPLSNLQLIIRNYYVK